MLWALLAVLSLALILRVTLVPTSDQDTGAFEWCLLCGDYGLSDFIANIILFVPVAAALRFCGVPAWKIIGGLFLLSVAIEIVQLWIPGRDSTLGDVASNTIGGAVGVGLASWWPRRRRSAVCAFLVVGVVLGAVAGAGIVLLPRFPAGHYTAHWNADWTPYENYGGRVLSAEIGGMPIPWDRLPDPRTARKHLQRGDTLLVRAIAGAAPQWPTQLFGIADVRRRSLLMLGVHRDELLFEISTSAPDLLLSQPELRWPRALAAIGLGDTLDIAAWRAGKNYCLRLNGRSRCGVAYATDQLWTLIGSLPGRLAGMEAVVGWVFVALLGLPVGLLAPRRAAGWIAAAVLLWGAALVPSVVGLAPLTLVDAAVLVASVAAGMLVPMGGSDAGRAREGTLPD